MTAIADPLFVRLTRLLRWPNALTLYSFLASQVAAFALATMFAANWRPIAVMGIRMYGLLRGNWVMLLILMVLTSTAGFIAAQITARDASRDDFQVMRLTMLSSRQIVHTYLLAALFRVRVLLIIALGAAAFFPASRLFDWIQEGSSYYYGVRFIPITTRVPIDWFMGINMVLAATMLGAMSGIWMGLSIRRATVAPLFGASAGLAVTWMIILSSLAVSRAVWSVGLPDEQRFLLSYMLSNSWFFVTLGLVWVMFQLALQRLVILPDEPETALRARFAEG
jgi:hypothetical protein